MVDVCAKRCDAMVYGMGGGGAEQAMCVCWWSTGSKELPVAPPPQMGTSILAHRGCEQAGSGNDHADETNRQGNEEAGRPAVLATAGCVDAAPPAASTPPDRGSQPERPRPSAALGGRLRAPDIRRAPV